MKNESAESAVAEREYHESDFFANNFARNFKSWNKLVDSYRLTGGHVPSRHHFDKAKLKNKKSVTMTD